WCAIFALLLFSLNALSAKAFGEAEFWFASIKVLAIILFIVLGGAAMFGFLPLSNGDSAPLFSNYTAHGVFPHGISAVLITMITVNFSFQGTE
ncbi:amino acid permease, partial [Priestia megaterium]